VTGGLGDKFPAYRFGDFNGDGRRDVLYIADATGCAQAGSCRQKINVAIADPSQPSGFRTSEWANAPTDYDPIKSNWYVGDLNGDGKQDLLWVGTNGRARVYLSTGTSFLRPQDWGGPCRVGDAGHPCITLQNDMLDDRDVHLADVNGDGLADLVYQFRNAGLQRWTTWVRL